MAASLTIYTEAAPLALDRAEAVPALGVTWFVSASFAPGDVTDPVVRDAFEKLLTPWRWTDLSFATSNVVLGAPLAPPAPANLAALQTRLDGLRDTLLADPAKFARSHEDDSETEPHWPLALLQLSRIDPGVAHALNLARLFEARFPQPAQTVEASIKSFKIGGLTVHFPSPSASATVELDGVALPIAITQELENVWSVDAIRQSGRLLDGYTRCVAEGGETRRDWFSGLAASLGRAISPLQRLADLLDHGSIDDAPLRVGQALRGLIECLVARTTERPSALALLFDHAAAAGLQQWETRIDAAVAEIADRLFADFFAHDQAPDTLRNVAQSEAFGMAVARELISRAPSDLAAIAERVLRDPRNLAALLDTLAASAIARRDLAPLLASAAGQDKQADAQPLLAAFEQAFREALVKLLGIDPVKAKAHLDAVADAQKRILEAELAGLDGLDAVQESGIAFRIDTVFKTLTQAEPDIHQTLDGALIAIRRSKQGLGKTVPTADAVGDWLPFEMVSRGRAEVEFAGAASPQPAVDLGLLTTPVPVGLVDDHAGAGSSAKVQQAIARFFGAVMSPVSDQTTPNPEAPEAAAIHVRYSGEPLDLDLAFGRAFHVEVGYQSLAGALPAGWCDPAAPFAFDRDRLAGSGGVTKKRVALLRTRPPGPPELADMPKHGAPLTRLTDARDRDVRPLWRERIAAWSDPGERRRVETASTVYLDFAQASQSRTVFVLPPSLSRLGAARVADNDRVWDYWIRRDRDFGAAAPVRHPEVPDPDPAVVGQACGTGLPQGGVLVTLLEVTPAGLKEIEQGQVLFDHQHAIELRLDCQDQAVPGLTAGPTTIVTLAPGRTFALELRTLVDARFFTDGDDPRFDDRLKAEPFPQPGTPTHYLFGAATLALECLPAIEHLPSQTALWDALRLTDQGGHTRCEWAPPADRAFDYVGTVQTVRQSWAWDGGPLDEAGLAALPWGKGETARPREAQWTAAEQAYFDERGLSGRTEDHPLGAGAKPGLLFEMPALPNRGADYLRVRATAISRYAALRDGAADLQALTRRQARAGGDAADIWKAIALRARRRDALATPSLALLAPMFGAMAPDAASAGDWCAYLDHPVYDPVNGGGLAERLVAEILVEHIDWSLSPEGPGETVALAAGLDPTLASDGDPYEGAGGHPPRTLSKPDNGSFPKIPDLAWQPAERIGARLPAKAVLGQTLEPLSAAPLIGFSLAFFDAAIGSLRLRPDTMIKVRLRMEADTQCVDGDAALLASQWSAAHWIVTAPNSDYHALFDPPVYDAARSALRLKLRAGHGADPRVARLKALIEDVAPDGAAPYLVRGLAAVAGAIVTDLHGAKVIRAPASTGPGPAPFLKAAFEGGDILFACPPPASGAHFLRLLELRTVSLPAPRPPSLDTLLPDSPTDVEGQLTAIGPLWQFEVD